MEVFDSWEELGQAGLKDIVAALGNFDGIHLGHRKLIGEAVSIAQKLNTKSAVVTFEPHPLKILAPEKFPKLLTTTEQRLKHFANLGVDYVLLLPFSHELAKLSPISFVERILMGKINVVHVCVGFNYSFGTGGAGGPEDLKQMGLDLGFSVSIIKPEKVADTIVSSTVVRGYLERGDIEEAERYLGYWPSLPGIVVHGEQRGRTIGFPTANVEPPPDFICPAAGVYAAWFELESKLYAAMVNIGSKPTFKDSSQITIEAHLFKFKRDIYDQAVEIYFRRRLRDERKFANVNDLLTQLRHDESEAYYLLKKDDTAALKHKQATFCI